MKPLPDRIVAFIQGFGVWFVVFMSFGLDPRLLVFLGGLTPDIWRLVAFLTGIFLGVWRYRSCMRRWRGGRPAA